MIHKHALVLALFLGICATAPLWAAEDPAAGDEDAITLTINLRTLFIEYIIIFKQMFTHVEICTFDAMLGLFDDIANQTNFKRKRVINLEADHQIADARN